MADVALVLHPACVSPVRSIRVSVARMAEGLRAHYCVEGDLGRVRIPAPASPGRVDGLWRHTCCELFVSPAGSERYREYNFSPSGEWAAYAFDGYRRPAANPDGAPRISVRAGSTLELEAEIAQSGKAHIAVSAVIEDLEGKLSYWALRHPPGKPDFHHRDGFSLELA